ncbi:KR domain-containing protein [Colletotrichum orchidophilum]|uniref:KR domain-containing protein n=1 Tax=Colletotrichum orchidophilum TaxID=1209926 RepID=A0A1G4B168_9PEZI|nr:KR domain-containing protein [Colletotrichum orchidophilum]OHE95179.1 KR domain-containing protein [Colletotrichum orchidophilum]
MKGEIISPCAGYIGTAGEAARQFSTGSFVNYSTHNAVIHMAMVFRSWEFTITSFNSSTWMKHCNGQVKALAIMTLASKKHIQNLHCDVGPQNWYQALQNFGANYGHPFKD